MGLLAQPQPGAFAIAISVCGLQLPRPPARLDGSNRLDRFPLSNPPRSAPLRSGSLQSAPRAPAAHEWEVVAASNLFSCLQLLRRFFWYEYLLIFCFCELA